MLRRLAMGHLKSANYLCKKLSGKEGGVVFARRGCIIRSLRYIAWFHSNKFSAVENSIQLLLNYV